MLDLLERLGHPERQFDSIHVVGSNGKSTATRTIAELLRAEGRVAGAYTSPHVSGWEERIWVDGEPADVEAAVERVRNEARAVGATQFESLTAAALLEFAERGVDAAVLEAGLGGRLDATNVVDAPVVLLTNVALEHTQVLGETLEEIAREKLAVAHAARVVVLPDNTLAHLVPDARVVVGGAHETAEEFLGRDVESPVDARLPGRLDFRSERPLELWDGAHNAAGVAWLAERLERRDFVLVVSILADKDVEAMLAALSSLGNRLVATASSSARAVPAAELARLARPLYASVEAVAYSVEALARGRELAGEDGALLVTGSLYLLADLFAAQEERVP